MKIDERMKKYERTSSMSLVHRMPAILRVDGRAFHTFTKNFDKPFDASIEKCMEAAALALCEEISTAKLGYGQSDEISILLVDYNNFDTMQWFDGDVSKICSIAASIATCAFNKALQLEILKAVPNTPLNPRYEMLCRKQFQAMFDARVFSIPREDAANYFVWRMQDATRNSVSSVGQANYSHKELHGVSTKELKGKLFEEKNIHWEKLPGRQKEGFFVCKETAEMPPAGDSMGTCVPFMPSSRWVIRTSDDKPWTPEMVNSLVSPSE